MCGSSWSHRHPALEKRCNPAPNQLSGAGGTVKIAPTTLEACSDRLSASAGSAVDCPHSHRTGGMRCVRGRRRHVYAKFDGHPRCSTGDFRRSRLHEQDLGRGRVAGVHRGGPFAGEGGGRGEVCSSSDRWPAGEARSGASSPGSRSGHEPEANAGARRLPTTATRASTVDPRFRFGAGTPPSDGAVAVDRPGERTRQRCEQYDEATKRAGYVGRLRSPAHTTRSILSRLACPASHPVWRPGRCRGLHSSGEHRF
jgi:hypothetical protein